MCGKPCLAAGCAREHQEPKARPLQVTREGWGQKGAMAGGSKSDLGGETCGTQQRFPREQ